MRIAARSNALDTVSLDRVKLANIIRVSGVAARNWTAIIRTESIVDKLDFAFVSTHGGRYFSGSFTFSPSSGISSCSSV